MSDSRQRDGEKGPLARARRFLGRVIETVRGSEHPAELVPASELVVSGATPGPHAMPHAPPSTDAASTPATPAPEDDLDHGEERVVELPSASLVPRLESPAASLLADASWSGLRVEDRGDLSLLAWRAADADADTLRIVEIRCDFGALDGAPVVSVTDRPASGVIGASTLSSDAARIVVALGSLRDGTFVSCAHAEVR